MNSVPPATALPRAPRKPPCWPPTDVPVCIWIAIDIHDSSPDSAKTFSLGCMFSSRTGITVPTIFDSIKPSLVAVVRVDHPAARCMRRRVARAIVADADHEHLGADRLEPMTLLEMRLELVHELLLDVHHPTADLAHRVMVIAARQLVVCRALTQVRRVNAARRRQRLEAEAVPDAMEEALSVAGRVDDAARGCIDLTGRDPRRHRGDGGVVSLQDDVVDLALPVAGLADHAHPRRVGLVTLECGAEVEQHEIARRQLPVRRSEVRKRGVGT